MSLPEPSESSEPPHPPTAVLRVFLILILFNTGNGFYQAFTHRQEEERRHQEALDSDRERTKRLLDHQAEQNQEVLKAIREWQKQTAK